MKPEPKRKEVKMKLLEALERWLISPYESPAPIHYGYTGTTTLDDDSIIIHHINFTIRLTADEANALLSNHAAYSQVDDEITVQEWLESYQSFTTQMENLGPND